MIDSNLQKELTSRYNPDGSNLRKAQMVMLELLLFFDKICKENNLSYWLDFGTLLGAVRHGGFIPWDDDVDVCMPREDAEKLKNIMGASVFEGHIVLQNQSTEWNYINCGCMRLRDLKTKLIYDNNDEDQNIHKMLKFQGLQLDIFEIEQGLKKWMKVIPNLFSYYFIEGVAKRTKTSFLRNVANFNARFFNKIIYPIFRLFKNSDTAISYAVGCPFFEKHNYNNIFPLQKISFENYTFNCPNNTTEYLKEIYGDWEKIPTQEEIITHETTIKFLNE